jgi:1,4-alpha-glucan branching enzyme
VRGTQVHRLPTLDKGGPGDNVVVVANFQTKPQEGYVIGFSSAGTWKLRFNSDWQGYKDTLKGHWTGELVAEPANETASPTTAGFVSTPTAC